jgi:hypothetical protein|tara:strand:+ start:164 stop:310 length:147 start_codon:yes stop_codon:yes gene_type:complete
MLSEEIVKIKEQQFTIDSKMGYIINRIHKMEKYLGKIIYYLEKMEEKE